MPMSKSEALQRALQIWGDGVEVRPSDVRGEWIVEKMVKTTHSLNQIGEVTCHSQCKGLEQTRDALQRLKDSKR